LGSGGFADEGAEELRGREAEELRGSGAEGLRSKTLR